jgi:hypothetical protein
MMRWLSFISMSFPCNCLRAKRSRTPRLGCVQALQLSRTTHRHRAWHAAANQIREWRAANRDLKVPLQPVLVTPFIGGTYTYSRPPSSTGPRRPQ